MSRRVYFITHPNVVISKNIPVPMWPLSDMGRERMRAGLRQDWMKTITSVYSSTEQKAIDGAEILEAHLKLKAMCIEGLGENDRSATGFLPLDEFERVADEFFASPNTSIRGWERAVDAQSRIFKTVSDLVAKDGTEGAIAVVSHGAVGALLYCRLSSIEISRKWDQPPTGGGNYFSFKLNPTEVFSSWQSYDGSAA